MSSIVLSTTPTMVSGSRIASRTWGLSRWPGSAARSPLWNSLGLLVAPERGETGLLLGLAAGAKLPGQQTGPGDRRDGGNGGEDRFAPVFVASRLKPEAAVGEFRGQVTSGGDAHAVKHQDERQPALGHRLGDALHDVLDQEQV